MAHALQIAENEFIISATFEASLPAKSVAILPIIKNNGAPGG
jgi:hypothetical protein